MLPKIDVPIYDLKLPSNGKEIKVRPFLVKEEKLLLMAVKTNDTQEIIKTTKQVVNNCILDSDINIETLPFFDMDYLFIALRAKSIGENIEVSFICKNTVDGVECDGKFPVIIDISNVVIDKVEGITPEIIFNSDLIFKMKYPSYSIIKTLDRKDDGLENQIKIMVASVDKIFTKGEYHSSKDFSTEELQEFIEGLTQEQFNKLSEFVTNFPSFYIEGKGTCPKCGKNHKVRYTDFVRFFQ